MERSERSSSGKAAGVPASPTHGAPGRGHALGEGGAAPPLDPDDPNNNAGGDAPGEEGVALEGARAEPWEPDANLMRALGLELEELRARTEAGEPDRSDDPQRPARPHAEGSSASSAPGAPAVDGEPGEPPTSDGRPPWW